MDVLMGQRVRRSLLLALSLVVVAAMWVAWDSSPAAALSSCNVVAGTATVQVDAPSAGTATTLARAAAGNLLVDGTTCGAVFPSVIDLEAPAGATPQRVVLDQTASGGIFPCSTTIQGALGAADTVEVDGAASEDLSVGSTPGGTGVNLNSCGTAGTLTGIGTYRLLAGTGSMIVSAAGGAGFVAPLNVPVALEATDGSSAHFIPGSAQTTIDFSHVTSSLTVNVSGQTVAATVNDSATAGGSTDTWTRNGPLRFVAAPTPTSFFAGTNADSFLGSGGQAMLSYAGASGTSLRVCAVASSGCAAGQALLGSVIQHFSGITGFVGLAGGNTTFVTGGVGGLQFNATGSGDAVDVSPAPAGTTVDAAVGTVTGPGSITPDSFSGVTHFVASSAGITHFVAGPTNESFVDPAAVLGDSIDFSNVPASAGSPLVVNVSGGPAGGHGDNTAAAGALSYDFTDGGAGFTAFEGSSAGQTVFVAGPHAGYGFTAHGATNTFDASATPAGTSLDAAAGTITGLSGGADTLGDPAAFATFIGSALGDTTFLAGTSPESVTLPGPGSRFVAATSSASVNLSGSGNLLDFSHLSAALTVNRSGQQVGPTANDTASAASSTYTWTSPSPLTFVGAAAATSFFAGSQADSFEGSGTGQATLSYADAPGTPLHVCVVAATSCTPGQAVLGAVTQSFSGITRFFGLATGNTTFYLGNNGGYDIQGIGTNNVLDVTGAATPVVDVPDGRVAGLAGSGQDTFTGIGFFDVDLYFTSAAPAGAVVGGSYHPVVPGTGSSTTVVVISVDAATTNAACTVDSANNVQLVHVGVCVLDANQSGDGQFATSRQVSQQFSVLEPTTMSFTASAGYPTLMHGVLRNGTGGPVAGKVVRLERRYTTTGTWTLVTSGTTTSTGSVSLSYPVAVKAYYRVRFLGDSAYASSTSATLVVKVYTKTHNARTASGLRATLLTGSNTRVRYLYLTLQQRPVGARNWSNVRTFRTNSVGTVTINKNPTKRTDYRWRFAGTTSYDANYSPVVRLY
ncbi:MAG: hypothetical protein JWQ32_1311 [Marmoricola sp.]|nr:hypothetical protein [Marmoricola sp.]